jgi:hypothetical protein
MLSVMDTTDAPSTPPAVPADDPRSPANIARRRALGIAERDPQGRLYPGSRIEGAGRKPDGVSVTVLARQHTDLAIRVLGEIANDPKAPQAARVAASAALLDRGWGKAPIQVDISHRAKFDDFLREVGLAAVYEHDHPERLPAVVDEVVIGPIDGEDPCE